MDSARLSSTNPDKLVERCGVLASAGLVMSTPAQAIHDVGLLIADVVRQVYDVDAPDPHRPGLTHLAPERSSRTPLRRRSTTTHVHGSA